MTSNTERAVAELFTNRPVSLADLESRVASASKKHVIRILVDKLVAGGLAAGDLELLRDALGIVGIGREGTRLAAVALDAPRVLAERAVAYLLLSSGTFEDLDRVEKVLEPGALEELADAAMSHDLRRMRDEPARAELVSTVLRNADSEEDFTSAVERMERLRKAVGLPAALAYGDALYHMELALPRLDRLIAIVEGEDCYETVDVMAQVLVAAEEMQARDRLRGPWRRARAKRAAPLGGEAWVSGLDAEGVFGVFGWFVDEALPGTEPKSTLVEVTIGDRGILNASMEPWADPDYVQTFLDDLAEETGVDFSEITLADAARLVAEAAERGAAPEFAPEQQLFAVYGASPS